ncbi:MAG: FG-GAP repeat domain-containing protein [Planctomycetota bacterium]
MANGDLDADGDDDLVVVTCKTEQNKRVRNIHICWNDSASGFTKASVPLDVPADSCCFAVADLAGEKGEEVVLLTPEGLLFYRRDGKTFKSPEPLLKRKLFFQFPASRDLPLWEFTGDLDGNGLEDIIIPVDEGYEILTHMPDGLANAVLVPAKTHESYSGTAAEREFLNRFFSVRLWKRIPYIVDENGDGKRDIVLLEEQDFIVYRQGNNGVFPGEPSRKLHLYFLDKLWGTGKRLENVQFTFDDINGDGRVDICFTHILGEFGIFSTNKTSHNIFFQKEDGSFSKHVPNQKVNVPGISMVPQLVDFDGDGDKDFLVSSLRTDLLSKITSVVRANVQISYMVYFYDDTGGGFSVTPDVTKTVDVPLSSLEKMGSIPLAYFKGDFNGDGRNDLLTTSDADRITVYPGALIKPWIGKPYYGFTKDPILRKKVKTSNWVRLADLNRDKRTDIIITYPVIEELKHLVSVVYSKK